MAQDGPHGHRDTAASNNHISSPPANVTFTLSLGKNSSGGSGNGCPVGLDASKRKGAAPSVHGEGSGSRTGAAVSKGKRSAADVTATDVANGDLTKGKGTAADDDATAGTAADKAHILTERERRKRMKNMFGSLHELLPRIPDKTDKATIVGEAIDFIRVLEGAVAKLEKRKLELALARQSGGGLEIGASSSSAAPPHAAQGGTSSVAVPQSWAWLPQNQQPAAPPAPPSLTPVGFQTWSGPNVVLSVSDDDAYINVCTPRRAGILTLVLSVLDKHRIDIVTTQVSSDGARSMFTIHARVNAAAINQLGLGIENPASEDIYKLAVSEIMVWLCS